MLKPWWAGLLVVLQVMIASQAAVAQTYTAGSAPTIDDLTYSSTSGYAASDHNNVGLGAMVTLAIPVSSWIDFDNLIGASGTSSTPDEIGQISWSVDSDVVALSETAGYYTSFTVPASLTDSTVTITATIRDSGLEGIPMNG